MSLCSDRRTNCQEVRLPRWFLVWSCHCCSAGEYPFQHDECMKTCMSVFVQSYIYMSRKCEFMLINYMIYYGLNSRTSVAFSFFLRNKHHKLLLYRSKDLQQEARDQACGISMRPLQVLSFFLSVLRLFIVLLLYFYMPYNLIFL